MYNKEAGKLSYKRSIALITSCMLIILIVLSSACASDTSSIIDVDDEGMTNIDTEALEETINKKSPQTLSDSEEEGILFMREEEKLARDVYLQLYQVWETTVFNNIGKSEQTHMEAMESLITRYGLADPVDGMDIGEYTDQILQVLHDELIEAGSKSEIDALKVGAAIEEIDIIDIEKYKSQTNKQDIITVYDNLLKGSRNHLRSFVSVIEKRGISYEPQYLSKEVFNDIIVSPIERGG